MATRDSSRAVTPEAFGKFLRWLSSDDDQAVREYQVIRKKMVRYFVQKSCTDPDQMFDEMVDIIVGKIDACTDIASPLAYCFGVARNVWRQNLRENKPVVLEWDVASPPHLESNEHERELQCLERCVERLAPNDRDVITRYHQGQGLQKIETRKLLANGLGGMNALRIKMCRIRKDLRRCVMNCLERPRNSKYSEVQEQ